jgi:hypothetical protein
MYPVRLRVLAVLRCVGIEFECDVQLSARPFVGLAVGLGRRGEDVPLFFAKRRSGVVRDAAERGRPRCG